MTEAQENIKAIGKDEEYFKDTILTADMGYHSGENIKRCEEEGIDAYIPDKNYRKRHPGLGVKQSSIASRRRKFLPEDFRYDEKTGDYECPAGKKLKRHTQRHNHDGERCIWHTGQMQGIVRCVHTERDALVRKVKKANGNTYRYRLNQTGEITHKRWQRKWTPSEDGRSIPSYKDSGAGFCQYTNAKAVGSLYPERESQGKHPVVTLLYGT